MSTPLSNEDVPKMGAAADIMDEAIWLTLHASLVMDAEYVQISTKDFCQHSSKILGLLSELDRSRRSAT